MTRTALAVDVFTLGFCLGLTWRNGTGAVLAFAWVAGRIVREALAAAYA